MANGQDPKAPTQQEMAAFRAQYLKEVYGIEPDTASASTAQEMAAEYQAAVGLSPDEARDRLNRPSLRQEILGSVLSGAAAALGGRDPAQQLMMQMSARRALTENGYLPPSGIGILDVAAGNFIAGTAKGFEEFFKPVPVIGPKLIAPYLTPAVQRANREALDAVGAYMQENAMAHPELMEHIPAIIAGSQLTGYMSGYLAPFMGYFRLFNTVLGLSGLGAVPVLGDMGAMAAYGFATKEGSLLSHMVFGPSDQSPHTHADEGRESFIDSLPERFGAAFFGAGEIGGLSVGIRALINTARTMRFISAWRTSRVVGKPLEEALATATRMDASGTISTGQITRQNFAELMAESDSFMELIMRDPKARKTLTETGSQYDAFVEAVRNLAPGNMGVITHLDDPFYLLSEAEQAMKVQEQLIKHAGRELTADVVLGKGPAPRAHKRAALRSILQENPDNPLFLAYVGAGENVGRGRMISTDPLVSATADGVDEVLIRASSKARVLRVESESKLLFIDPPNVIPREAAWRFPNGQVVRGRNHADALEQARKSRATQEYWQAIDDALGSDSRIVGGAESAAGNEVHPFGREFGERGWMMSNNKFMHYNDSAALQARQAKQPQPRKMTWDDVLEKHGEEFDLIVIKSPEVGSGQGLYVLNDDVLRSSRRINVSDVEMMKAELMGGAEPGAARVMGEITAGTTPMPRESVVTALARRFDNLHVEIADVAGRRMAIFWDRRARPPQHIIDQFQTEGFFKGQEVRYRNGTWLYEKRLGSGEMAADTRVRIRSLENPKRVAQPQARLVQSLYKGSTLPESVSEGFLPAIDNNFQRYVERELLRLSDDGFYFEDMRTLVDALERPGLAKVDRAIDTPAILYPEDTPGGIQHALSRERHVVQAIKDGEATFNFPEPIPNEMDMLWNRFVAENGELFPSLSPPQVEAVKWGALHRMRERLYAALPAEEQRLLQAMERELSELIDNMPNNLQTQSMLRGFELIETADGPIVWRAGTKQYKWFDSDDAALKYLEEVRPIERELLPNSEYVNMTREGAMVPGGRIPSGDGIIDWATAPMDDFVKLYSETGIPSPWWNSMRYVFESLENQMPSLPVLTRWFEPLVLAQKRMSVAAQPYKARIDGIWKPIGRERRVEIGKALRTIRDEAEYADVAVRRAKLLEEGLSEREIRAVDEMAEVFNDFYVMGVERGIWEGAHKDFMYNYFSHISPRSMVEGGFNRHSYKILPKSVDSFWAKYIDNNMMNVVELDPWIIMKRYSSAFFFENEVGPVWERARAFTDIRWKSIPKETQDQLIEAFGGSAMRKAIKGNDYALPPPLYRAMNEVLTYVRGYPQQVDSNLRKIFSRVFNHLGIKAQGPVLDELVNIQQAMWYGAALGYRPIPIVRNFTQNLWNMYPRVGGKAISSGLADAQTVEGFSEALEAGAFKTTEKGVFFGEESFQKLLEEANIIGTNPASRVLANIMNLSLRLGRPLQRVSAQGMKAFGASDIFNRVWAYHAQKNFIMPWINRFQAGEVTEQQLMRRGLEFWGRGEKNEFMRILKRDGSDAAARYIGRQAADVTQYIYGMGAQPLLLQNTPGRLLGTFATWPIWQLNLLRMNWRNASLAGRMKLAARYALMTGAITSMSYAWGVNMVNWIAPIVPFSFGGGPAWDTVQNLRDIQSSPWAWKAKGVGRLAQEYFRLSFPGQLAMENFGRSLQEGFNDNPWSAYAALMIGRPVWGDENPYTNPRWGVDSNALMTGGASEGDATLPQTQAPPQEVPQIMYPGPGTGSPLQGPQQSTPLAPTTGLPPR